MPEDALGRCRGADGSSGQTSDNGWPSDELARKGGLARDVGLDEVVDHFTLGSGETRCLRSKTGSTRLGFAVRLKFLRWCGRFPKMRLELGGTGPGGTRRRSIRHHRRGSRTPPAGHCKCTPNSYSALNEQW